MKLKGLITQNRRDFYAICECDHCEATETWAGNDDYYSDYKVTPKMVCSTCGEVARSKYSPLATKYAAESEV